MVVGHFKFTPDLITLNTWSEEVEQICVFRVWRSHGHTRALTEWIIHRCVCVCVCRIFMRVFEHLLTRAPLFVNAGVLFMMSVQLSLTSQTSCLIRFITISKRVSTLMVRTCHKQNPFHVYSMTSSCGSSSAFYRCHPTAALLARRCFSCGGRGAVFTCVLASHSELCSLSPPRPSVLICICHACGADNSAQWSQHRLQTCFLFSLGHDIYFTASLATGQNIIPLLSCIPSVWISARAPVI